jgi:AraC-like DNA-binding protein
MQRIVFDADKLPGGESRRKEQWIEQLSTGYVRLNAEPAQDISFQGKLRIAALGQASVGTIQGTVKAIIRSKREIALEDTDNLVLLCNAGRGQMHIMQNGRSADLVEGASVLIEQCCPSQVVTPRADCKLLALQVPRSWLSLRLPELQSHIMMPVSRYSSALKLARAYTNILLRDHQESGAQLKAYAAEHIADLIAAVIAPHRAVSDDIGVRAARLRALKEDITQHLGSSSLSISETAARQGISAAYVRKLLAAEGISFSDFVLEQRLSRAHRMLRDPRFVSCRISTIAFETGFSDLSYFNRTFRRRFGMTPSYARNHASR